MFIIRSSSSSSMIIISSSSSVPDVMIGSPFRYPLFGHESKTEKQQTNNKETTNSVYEYTETWKLE